MANKKMAKKKVECLRRKDFTESRYKAFLMKRPVLQKYAEERKEKMHLIYAIPKAKCVINSPPFDLNKNEMSDVGMMIDLDHHCPEIDGPYKDLLQCDLCNQNIEEQTFIMVENSRVYHESCQREHYPELDVSGVINKTHEAIYEEMQANAQEGLENVRSLAMARRVKEEK